MKRSIPILFVVFLAAVLLGPVAWQAWGPLPDSVAARINGEDLPADTLAVFVAAARRADPTTTPQVVLKGLVENRLLAGLAEHDDHHGHHAAQVGSGNVGYDRDTVREQQRFRLLRSAFAEPLRAAVQTRGADNSLTYLTQPLELDATALAPMLTLEQALYTTMTEAQQQAAKQYVLARYRFAESQPEQTLSLWDLYRRQNIQLKVQMHNLNLAFVREAIKQQLTMEFVFYWFEQESGLSRQAVAAVDRCLDDALHRDALLHEMGLMHDIHDDNPALREQAGKVTQQQIAGYYAANKDQFTRVERVRGRHLRVDSQQAADRIVAEIRDGLSFEQAIAQYSLAEDARDGGQLGWIDRETRNDHWMLALAFVQPEGRVSAPFRSPAVSGAPYWEILQVDEKVMGYQPLDSESVRYRASLAIAREQLEARFRQQLADASADASLRINQGVM